MRAPLAAVLSLALSLTPPLAQAGTLAPGKPAGTKQAQLEAGGVLLVAGIVAIAAVIAVVASETEGNGTTTPKTTPSATTT